MRRVLRRFKFIINNDPGNNSARLKFSQAGMSVPGQRNGLTAGGYI